MRRHNWIISLILVLASIAFATSALARPFHDGPGPDVDRYPFYRVLSTAVYDPGVLDYDFFEYLSATPRRSPEWRNFRASLAHIDWYSQPFARQWIRANMHRLYNRFLEANRVSVYLDFDVPEALRKTLMTTIGSSLPGHAYFINNATYADVVISVDGSLGEPFVYERSAAAKTVKFKKKYRRRAARAGFVNVTYASYTTVKATAALDYDIRVKVTSNYKVLYQARIAGRARDNFKFVRDLRSYSASGEVAALLFPNGKVKKRFRRNSNQYRAGLYGGLARKIGRTVAGSVAIQGLPLRYALLSGTPYQRVTYGYGVRTSR